MWKSDWEIREREKEMLKKDFKKIRKVDKIKEYITKTKQKKIYNDSIFLRHNNTEKDDQMFVCTIL